MTEVYNTAISGDHYFSDVPSSGFKDDPIMSIDGALKLNNVYGLMESDGTRIFVSGNDQFP